MSARTPRTCDLYPIRNERGPNGRRMCRVCGEREVRSFRSTYCSDDCHKRMLLTTDWGCMRHHVWKRDRGVCQLCGFDMGTLERILDAVWRIDLQKERLYNCGISSPILLLPCYETIKTYIRNELGLPWGAWWNCDHVIPLDEGGPHEVDNLRVLCVKCHKRVTREQAGRRAKRRAEARAIQKK